MLIIKDTQIETFNRINYKQFVANLKKHLEKCFPNVIERLKKDELNFFIEEGIKKAQNYKLETEYQVTVYFDFMLTFGVDFELDNKNDWAKKILTNKHFSANDKVEDLLDYVEDLKQEIS